MVCNVFYVRKIRNNRPVSRKGIRCYSPLLDLEPRLDIVKDIPIEEFHLLKEGLTKHMITRITKGHSVTAREITSTFQAHYIRTKVFSESPRRPRRFNHISKFKGLSVCLEITQNLLINVSKFLGNEYGLIMFTALPCLISQCFPAQINDFW